MLALLDAGRWAWSFITAHWKGAVILLAVLLVWGYGRWQYSVGEAHADAIWAERVEAARVAAARQEERWNGRLDASEKERNELRQDVEVRDGIIGRVNDSVRQLAARPRNLPPPASYAACLDDLAREREWAAEGRSLLAEGAGLSATLGRERDLNALDLCAAAEAWPR